MSYKISNPSSTPALIFQDKTRLTLLIGTNLFFCINVWIYNPGSGYVLLSMSIVLFVMKIWRDSKKFTGYSYTFEDDRLIICAPAMPSDRSIHYSQIVRIIPGTTTQIIFQNVSQGDGLFQREKILLFTNKDDSQKIINLVSTFKQLEVPGEKTLTEIWRCSSFSYQFMISTLIILSFLCFIYPFLISNSSPSVESKSLISYLLSAVFINCAFALGILRLNRALLED